MESTTKVAVIIVNWNGWKDTLTCLASLENVQKKNVRLDVIVVDNGSRDNSVLKIKEKFPQATVLETGINLGFTGGNNVGMRHAMKTGADYVWLLNNDTFVDINVLSVLKAFDDPNVGIAGSKIYFASGREFHHDRYKEKDRGNVIWYAGGIVDWDNMYASHRGVDEVDHGKYNKAAETSFITGCSMMIKREVIERIGLLDERYYLYLEDLDYCIRTKRAGFRLMYAPTSYLWHINAGSSDRPGNPLHEYYFTRNRLLLGFQYASIRTKFALLRESVKFLFTGSSVRRRAIFDMFTGRFGNRFKLSA